MNTVLLVHNSGGFIWQRTENISVRGYLFDRSGQFFESESLLEYFSGISSFSDLEERVTYANGCFSVIFSLDEDLYIASDSVRTFPVFYRRFNDDWIISDDANALIKNYGKSSLNELACNEFLATGCVTGDETLTQEIFQVQAGELIHLHGLELKRKFFFTYRTHQTSDAEYDELRKFGIEVFGRTFSRFINGLEGRTVIVPLSGGYDSRLIAVMLKKSGYTKVICITYGRPENPEIKISRKVAEILGFKWICIEYTDELVKGFIDDPYFKNYFPFASNLVSMFFLQEYFAIRYLKEKQLIPDDSLFVPGHSGDFIGGSHLGKYGNLLGSESTKEIADRLLMQLYSYIRPEGSVRDTMLNRIEKNLDGKFTGEHDLAYTIQEDWDFKEKLAKFITNSVSTYTFFGYGFRLPFWDKELVEFFKLLPLHMKINKYLYDDILTNEFFELAGVNFDEELQVTEKIMKRQRFKNRIKHVLPQSVMRLFLTRLDNLYYNEITRELVNDMARKGKKIEIYNNSYNSLIIQWYLEKMKESLRLLD
jgi:asparagine synthase (glutamine-hydrolysing)